MNTVTLHFRAEGQKLIPLDGIYKYASNTVEYIRAVVDLGDDWTDFDVVRAAWFTDYDCIVTVLDPDGVCVVPAEVLNKRAEVCVNLFGCDVEEDELVDRLTTYPIKAILIDANARVCGSETAPVTPSQFEQFIAIVEDIVHSVKDIDHTELNADYTLTIYYTDGTSDTVGPIRGEQGPVGPTGNGISKIEKVGTAGLVDTYRITYTNGQTYEYTVTNGAQGPQGNGIVSIYKSGESGAVKTYTILFTDGNTFEYNVTDGEVTFATLEQLMPKDTASGAIASFPDGQAVFPLKSCVVVIDPVQDLHGYDKPWVGGAGKNKLDQSAYTSLDGATYSNGKFTSTTVSNFSGAMVRLFNNGAVVDTINHTVIEGQRVALNVPFDNTWDSMFIGYRMSGVHNIGGYYDKPNLADGTYTISFMVDIKPSASIYGAFSNIQLESGSSATSFEPYANICPITGWTGCEVTVCGKNLFDVSTISQVNSTASNIRWGFLFTKQGTYTIKANASSSGSSYISARIKSADGTYGTASVIVSAGAPQTAKTLTVNAGDTMILFNVQDDTKTTATSNFTTAKVQVEFSSSATDFEAYNGTTYPVSWQTEAGTVYGGTVDLVTGVLTVEYKKVALNGTEAYANYWSLPTTHRIGVYLTDSATEEYSDFWCSHYKPTAYNSLANGGVAKAQGGNTAYIIKDDENCVVDIDTYKAYVIQQYNNGTPIEFVIKLAAPTTYQLDPVQVACLLGQNNVWADCGAVAVRYIADIQGYIDKKTS